MGVPLRYNVRSLIERKATTLMTALGIALTVAVLVTALSLANGLERTFAASAHPLHVVTLRKGATSELTSGIEEKAFREIRLMPQVAKNESGEPLASAELVVTANLPSVDSPAGSNLTVRGLRPVGTAMHDGHMVEGRWFQPGRREIVVGKMVPGRYPSAQIGRKVHYGRSDWEVVGVFTSGEGISAANSEIWCDFDQLGGDMQRQGGCSSVLVRATDRDALHTLMTALSDNQRLGVDTQTEAKYYADMTSSGLPLEALGMFVAAIMAVGSAFGAMNTMYAAVARRGREIATLRALGFSRFSILRSFFAESVLLSLFGGLLGCLLTLPLNRITTGVGSFTTFSEVAFNFHVGVAAIAVGLVFAASIGAVGGFLPAWAASRRNLLVAMRES